MVSETSKVNSRRKHAISISVNDSYVPYALLLLESLRRNWPNYPPVLVQNNGLTEQSRAILSSVAGVNVCSANSEIEGPPINLIDGADTKATYLRLNLWSTDFQEYDNILYLDADTIVLHPLESILNAERFTIFGDPFYSTSGMFLSKDDPALLTLLTEDNFALGSAMANAGVFVVPKHCRTDATYACMMDLLNRYKSHLRFSDQTVINLWLLREGIAPLEDQRFNFLVKQPPAVLDRIGMNNIHVLHFAGFSEQSNRRKLLMKLAVKLGSTSLTKVLYAQLQKILLEVGPNYRHMLAE